MQERVDLVENIAAAGGEHEDRAGARERQRRTAAEAARGAGDDDDFSIQGIVGRTHAPHAGLSLDGAEAAGSMTTLMQPSRFSWNIA